MKNCGADLVGKRFGRLYVLEETEGKYRNGKHIRLWKCLCDCGNTKIASYDGLTAAKCPSCGCYVREIRSDTMKRVMTTHGHRKERLYHVWCNMRYRCEKPGDKEYHRYGGRGIKVCDEWHDYAFFRKWAYDNGYEESALRGACTLDRIDNDGNYEPGNCRFSNMKNQANNTSSVKRYSYNGSLYTLSEIMDISHNMPVTKKHILCDFLQVKW